MSTNQEVFQTFTSPHLYQLDNQSAASRFLWRVRSRAMFVGPPDVRKVVFTDVLALTNPQTAGRPMDLSVDTVARRQVLHAAAALAELKVEWNALEVHQPPSE